MDAKEKKITESLLGEIANKIVEHFHPDQIILFGSYAYGEPKTDSDLDLLVIMDTDPQPRAIKPAVPFSSDVDLANTADPFSDMTLEDRRRAIGGPDVAEKYLRIITKQLARVMADNKLRWNKK